MVPYPKIALSPPYPAAARLRLIEPTPVTSLPTTPVLDTRLVSDKLPPILSFQPNPKIAFCVGRDVNVYVVFKIALEVHCPAEIFPQFV